MSFIQKILLLGSETTDTDDMASALANSVGTVNHGLVSSVLFAPTEPGYYHTTVADLTPGEIVNISKYFDCVQMLDQPKETYPHYKSFVITLRLMADLESQGIATEYKNNKSAENLMFWQQYLKDNKSFCFYPFVVSVNDQGDMATTCAKSTKAIRNINDIVDWATDPVYTNIRNKMLAGEKMPDICKVCYDSEDVGVESARQYETLEWAQQLSLEKPEDFLNFKSPVYYELRPSNKCNIMCRTCDDAHSHLIEAEWKTIGFRLTNWKFGSAPFDKIDFTSLRRVYVGGGEPTIMTEFYDFLAKCIAIGKTDFELCIGTNGMKFSNKLLNLLDHFPRVLLSFSYDGYDLVNDYIRWKSDFKTMVDNSRILRQRGHTISLQTVFTMWNVTNLDRLFEFYDTEYPESGLLVQPTGNINAPFTPFNHPRPDLVLESMRRCQQTKTYHTHGRSVKSMVDSIVEHYSNPAYTCDLEALKGFFDYNDTLDHSRNCRLGDYVPELEACRSFILND